jgi:hypothetical protein
MAESAARKYRKSETVVLMRGCRKRQIQSKNINFPAFKVALN